MKKISTYLLFLVVFFGLQSFQKADPMNDVIEAIKKSNTSLLAAYFDNTVEIALPDKSDSYNKTQAEIVLKDFFTSNLIKSFIVEHTGNNNGSRFCIGHLYTSKANFRITLFMKLKNGASVLQEIRIENER
jgi:hypothetical protein